MVTESVDQIEELRAYHAQVDKLNHLLSPHWVGNYNSGALSTCSTKIRRPSPSQATTPNLIRPAILGQAD